MSKVKECWNCRYYRAFYTKGFSRFNKQKIGICNVENRIIGDKHISCDKWCNGFEIKNIRQVAAIKRIDETTDCFIQIKQILIEEKEELQDIKVIELPSINKKIKKYLSD